MMKNEKEKIFSLIINQKGRKRLKPLDLKPAFLISITLINFITQMKRNIQRILLTLRTLTKNISERSCLV